MVAVRRQTNRDGDRPIRMETDGLGRRQTNREETDGLGRDRPIGTETDGLGRRQTKEEIVTMGKVIDKRNIGSRQADSESSPVVSSSHKQVYVKARNQMEYLSTHLPQSMPNMTVKAIHKNRHSAPIV